MVRLVALLRAVNVGGTGRLAMADLRALAAELGFHDPQTYLASGNLVFGTDLPAEAARARLAGALATGVVIRTGAELAAVADGHPFAAARPTRAITLFLPRAATAADLAAARGAAGEEMACGPREIFLHYPAGQGRSRLVLPAMAEGTARNLSTVRALAAMAG